MSTIRSTTLLWSLVDLDMLDNEITRVKTLGIGIGFGVVQEVQEELGGFNGPPSSCDAECFACLCPMQQPQ